MRVDRRHLVLLVMISMPALPAVLRAEQPSADVELFESRIRPVLVAHCYECHGPDGEAKGGLRLDSRDGWRQGGDSGPAIVPGKPDESLLLQAIQYDPSFVEMPPRGRLPERVIEDFANWIARGAVDPREAADLPGKVDAIDLSARAREHWAYQPLAAAAAPEVTQTDWPRTPVDRFILAKLEQAGLEPAADADPATLVRRLYFDLIGLPPTPEQLDAVLQSEAPDRFERLVDELLASPHFGERWARHWLDVVRYGESLTLRGLILPDAWRFRDYVIEAFNEDLPYDQFLREHIAGDLLPADSVEQRRRQCVATTFLTLGNWNLEEQDKKQLRMDVVDEQLDTIGKAFLAQTIGCARCHDHKFDPIPAADYYALAGILRNVQTLEDANVSKWLERPLPLDAETEAAIARHEAAAAELDRQIRLVGEQIAALDPQAKLPDVAPVGSFPGVVIDGPKARAVGQWALSQSNKPYIGEGYLHDQDAGKGEKTLTFEPELQAFGRYEVRLAYTAGGNRATNVPVTVFSADGEQSVAVNQRKPPPLEQHWVSLGTYRFEPNGQCFVIVANDGADGHVIADAVQFLPVEQVETAAAANDAQPTDVVPEQADRLQDMRTELAALKQQLSALNKSGPSRPSYVGVREHDAIEETFVHVRGSVHQLGAPVRRGFLSAVPVADPPELPSHQSGRLELADWLTRPDNALVARVYVNRVWHWLFGAGLVRTTDNFGLAGESPSHPELLDRLSAQFIADGWSTKRLIRRLVLSRTYALSSGAPDSASDLDPENRLLSHVNRRRLDAECIRDAMLAISGELDLARGGSEIKPGMAADYEYRHEHFRRSVYCAVVRNRLPGLFEAFDFADPSTVTGVRNTSTVAPQALWLMNDPFVIERAQHAAARMLSATELSREAQIELAFRRTLGRGPMATEYEIASRRLGESPSSQDWQELMHALMASMDFRYLN